MGRISVAAGHSPSALGQVYIGRRLRNRQRTSALIPSPQSPIPPFDRFPRRTDRGPTRGRAAPGRPPADPGRAGQREDPGHHPSHRPAAGRRHPRPADPRPDLHQQGRRGDAQPPGAAGPRPVGLGEHLPPLLRPAAAEICPPGRPAGEFHHLRRRRQRPDPPPRHGADQARPTPTSRPRPSAGPSVGPRTTSSPPSNTSRARPAPWESPRGRFIRPTRPSWPPPTPPTSTTSSSTSPTSCATTPKSARPSTSATASSSSMNTRTPTWPNTPSPARCRSTTPTWRSRAIRTSRSTAGAAPI